MRGNLALERRSKGGVGSVKSEERTTRFGENPRSTGRFLHPGELDVVYFAGRLVANGELGQRCLRAKNENGDSNSSSQEGPPRTSCNVCFCARDTRPPHVN